MHFSALRTTTALSFALLVLGLAAEPANAGFQWTPPAQTAPAAAPPPPSSDEPAPPLPAPLPDVDTVPLSSEPAAPAPKIDLYPLKEKESAAPAAVSAPAHPSAAAIPAAPSAPVVAVPAAASVAGGYPQAVGFGKQMPLALAMRQIVPPEYGYSFGDRVDPGMRIDWQGNAPWDQVLRSALAPYGLQADISGERVRIEGGSSMPAAIPAPAVPMTPAPLPVVAPPPAADTVPAHTLQVPPGRLGNMVPRAPSAAPDMAMTPPPQSPPEVNPATGVPVVKNAPDVYSPRNDKRRNEKLAVPTVMPSTPAASSAPVPIAGPAPMPSGDGLTPPPDLPPVSTERWNGSGTAVSSPDPDKPLPTTPADSGTAKIADVAGEPLAMHAQSAAGLQGDSAHVAPVSMAPYSPDAVDTWVGKPGATLRDVLTQWSDRAGVQLQWLSEYDYPLQSGVTLHGTYAQAVDTVLSGLVDAQPRPVGRLHPNLPKGPAVLIIETRHIIE